MILRHEVEHIIMITRNVIHYSQTRYDNIIPSTNRLVYLYRQTRIADELVLHLHPHLPNLLLMTIVRYVVYVYERSGWTTRGGEGPHQRKERHWYAHRQILTMGRRRRRTNREGRIAIRKGEKDNQERVRRTRLRRTTMKDW